ncbi:hypothetical protein A2U01_0092700 [Trifolium medium]|uniref:Uncharacterized protein n=1 Tax=Trifolium medium TaxID=97028 RepID=A0A392UF20_9FABA|nr:hypothetical protein [Trifolium medium]
MNTGADGGCEVDPDAADVVLPVVVVAVVLPLLPVALSLPSERKYHQGVAQLGLSHQCPPRWGHPLVGREW